MKNGLTKLTAWVMTLAMAFTFMLPVWATDKNGDPGGSLSAEEPRLIGRSAKLESGDKYTVTLKFAVSNPAMSSAKNPYVMLNSCDFTEPSAGANPVFKERTETQLTIEIPGLTHSGTGNSFSAQIGFEYEDSGTHVESLEVSTTLPGIGSSGTETLDGVPKFIGYKIISDYGWIHKDSKVDIRLYIMDSDLLDLSGSGTVSPLYLTLSECSFTYDGMLRPFLNNTESLKKQGIFAIDLIGVQYTGTGKNLNVELGYRLNGVDKTCPISAIINECIEYTEPEPEEPPSSSDPIVLDSLKPNILLESFAFRSERKPAAGSSEESGAQSSSEPSASGDPEPVADKGPENVISAGTPFSLSFSLKNTSRNIAVQNMVIKVDGGEKFRLQSGTDTLYVEKLAPQASSSQTLSFNTPANTEPGSYPVTLSVSFEYYDKDAKLAGEAALSLSLPVGSVDRIRFNSLSVPMENYVGNDVSLSYSIINAGFTTLYNAEILVYDDTDTLLASKYVGTVEPSKEIKGNDISLNFMSAGDYNLRMVFQYEDEMLQVSSSEQTCLATVMEYDMPVIDPEPYPDDPIPDENGGFPMWTIWVGVAAVVLIGGGVTTGILLKKRKAKAQAELEDYDEDL